MKFIIEQPDVAASLYAIFAYGQPLMASISSARSPIRCVALSCKGCQS
jgi:hypothetical protein